MGSNCSPRACGPGGQYGLYFHLAGNCARWGVFLEPNFTSICTVVEDRMCRTETAMVSHLQCTVTLVGVHTHSCKL